MKSAVILAAGRGERFKSSVPKQLVLLRGKPMILYSLEIFQNHSGIDNICLVVSQETIPVAEKIIKERKLTKVSQIIKGGETRQESSRAGVYAVADRSSVILVHDAARPLVSEVMISKILKELNHHPAVIPAIYVSDTIVEEEKGLAQKYLEREQLRRIQTPQGFRAEILLKAHQLAEKDGFKEAPDDSFLIFKYLKVKAKLIEGEVSNIKITFPSDLQLAEFFLEKISGGKN